MLEAADMGDRADAKISLVKRHGAYLPHWMVDGGTYSVTFRLQDSLPIHVVEAYREERERLLAAVAGEFGGVEVSAGDLKRLHELFSDRIEKFLDAGLGECWLRQRGVAKCVQEALFFFHGKRYELKAWAVMPNHVHVVFVSFKGVGLSSIMHSWKSYTAKEANRLLGRKGAFWQAESYDHLVRDEEDLRHCVEYTARNPEAAGLVGWEWAGKVG